MNNMHTCVAQRHLCNTATQGGEREGEEEGEGEGEDLGAALADRQLHGVSRLPWNQHKNHIPRASPFTALGRECCQADRNRCTRLCEMTG